MLKRVPGVAAGLMAVSTGGHLMFSMTLEDHIKADTEEMTPEIFKDLQQQGFREM